jgi:hypothetical protein
VDLIIFMSMDVLYDQIFQQQVLLEFVLVAPVLCVAGLARNQHACGCVAVDGGVYDLVCTHTEAQVLQQLLQRLVIDAFIASAHARVDFDVIRQCSDEQSVGVLNEGWGVLVVGDGSVHVSLGDESVNANVLGISSTAQKRTRNSLSVTVFTPMQCIHAFLMCTSAPLSRSKRAVSSDVCQSAMMRAVSPLSVLMLISAL